MSADWAILNWIHNNLQCGFLDFLMPKITVLGNMGMIWIAAAIAMLCSRKYRKHGIMLVIGLLLSLLTGNIILKHLVARPRPCWLNPDITLLIPTPTDYSFPSGHTLSGVISAVILTHANRKFGYAAIPLAAVLAFSRLYLYVHFPSDVLASICLGLLIGFCVLLAEKKFRNSKVPS